MKHLIFFFFFASHLLSASIPDEVFLIGDNFMAFCDHHVHPNEIALNPSEVQPADTIFVLGNCLELFFKEFHPHIKNPYILVSHGASVSIPYPFGAYLQDPKIIAWFGQNIEHAKHPKLHPIPLGLQHKGWWFRFGDLEVTRKKLCEPEKERTIELYMNFAIGTYKQERSVVYNLFKNQEFCHVATGRNFEEYLDDLSLSKFALSPRGYGLDCHRTWECLLMGAIPIVKTSELDPLFEDLPVLVVKSWGEITPRFLKMKYEEMKSKTYNLEKTYILYWLNLIEMTRRDYLTKLASSRH